MILTWKEIINEYNSWNIKIKPFVKENINPNSYNYHLWNTIKVFDHFDWEKSVFKTIVLSEDGYVLKRGQMYLWCTQEEIWSSKYMISLIGRSSVGRLWMFLQLSANVWHTWTSHQWTLEIYPTCDIKIYPGMVVGQVSFWVNKWDVYHYSWEYKFYSGPQESLLLS